ncbi:sodium:solute symporter family protein [Hoyosella sp. YIM 151337]|uniref:sodium:solute symporter family protein n=1 Tax=Hoyosella sp. YIM 151337 TaxID=2992742 RepID=UPI0022364F13|nr:sodium:solute symporter family protein [Hoyosella sp. YIM 151337]MCW4353490.1 sodium:solute symporter family protein [Hoyosella sp. YIM 151337]
MILFGVTLSVLALLAAGLYAAKRVHGQSANYLLAGRSLSIPLVAIVLASQAIDSNGTLGNTDLTADFGFWAGAALPIGLAACLIIAGLFFAKRMREIRVVTLPEYFERRFGRSVELPASALTVSAFGILLAGNLVAIGFLLDRFAGIPYSTSILIAVPFVLAYTIAGGMFSSTYVGVGMIILNIFGVIALMTWMTFTHGFSAPEGMGPLALGQLTNAEEGAVLNWATITALALGNLVAIDLMQRIFSARCPRTAQRACFGGAALILALCIPFSLVALAAVSIIGPESQGPVLFALLGDYAPTWLAILVLSGLVAASLTTASGVLLSTATVIVKNILRLDERTASSMNATRLAMVPMALLGAFFALRIPQTGILLTLTFDLLLAGLVVPFILGLYWSRGGTAAALAAIISGVAVRVFFFITTPTVYGVENTLLFIPNNLVPEAMDGWSTFLAALVSLIAYVAVAGASRTMTTLPAPHAVQRPEPVRV